MSKSIKSEGIQGKQMTEKEMKAWIDQASYEELLTKWRFAPSGSLWFQGEVGKYFELIMSHKRAHIGDEAAVQASKNIGW